MAKKKKKVIRTYDFIVLRVSDYSARVDASINYEVRDSRYATDETKIYSFNSALEVTALSTWPEDHVGLMYYLTIYGHKPIQGDFDLTLGNFHVRNKDGFYKYRKRGGLEVPVYEPPKGIGLIEKVRGANRWNGSLWVHPKTVSDMLTLLTTVEVLYLFIHEMRLNRQRWILGLTLQTTDPEEE